ncbi:MAG: glycosyltransferase [Lachnospiraceae bacterium]|nr:glycosyltransferase [Lachnospiraceae bacterium]
MIKVVHIGTTDEGGAYGAMVRISECLTLKGVDSSILLRNKRNDKSIGRVVCTGYRRLISKIKNYLNLKLSFENVQTDYLGENILNEKEIKEADVIFLHWTNSFLSYKSIKNLAKLNKPIVYVMHDMWLMTGGCHIDNYCSGYKNACIDCPYAKNHYQKYLAMNSFLKKKEILKFINPVIVTPSKWLGGMANSSKITTQYRKYVINNPVDTEIFCTYPDIEKMAIRKKYKIPAENKLIIFSAFNATRSINKGFGYLKEALKKIDTDNYSLLICGDNKNDDITSIGKVKVIYTGFINDRSLLAKIYSTADVVTVPSKQENYSGVALEALSCGTPVTAFDIGGMPEIISHKEDGYIAEFANTDQLCQGIIYCANNKKNMCKKARDIRIKKNKNEIIGEKYYNLLIKLINN